MKTFTRYCISILLVLPAFFSNLNAQTTCTFPNQTVAAANTVLNTYYPGTANVAIGGTSITLGAAVGSATPIAAGDLVMIIQMQDATQSSVNTTAYGDGVAGAPASGYLVANAGTYEYGIATGAVPLAGGTLNLITGTANAYTNAAASATQGQIRFQVIRVPRFNNLTINAATSITCTAWNGTAGGVVVLDVNGTLNMNTTGQIHANARGFRGGGGRQLGGGGGANTDIRTNATVNTNGAKGEGICGTPRYVFDGTALVNTGVEGYPNGSNANGAPGNAGGGGTDANPGNNDENTGGGGGGNAGAGGRGGRSWNSNQNIGGYGGINPAFLATTRVVMGGGGGSGTTNDGTGALPNGLSSSGGIGGGIVILKVNTITNAGTITANGANGGAVNNDGGGGGGAGGTVYISATVPASLATLTVNTIGGNGGSAWATQADAGGPNDGNPEHGPGGGGGGGAIYSNGNLVGASSVAGGTNGITTTSNLAFGATAGGAGVKNQAATAITLPTLPNPTASSNTPVCAGSALNLTSAPTLASATYSWTGPNSFVSAVQNPTIAAATLAATGTYSVSYTLGSCTAGPATTAVVVNAAPSVSNAGPDASVCGLVATLAGNTPASGTGTWTQVAGPGTTVFSNANSPTSTATASVAGAYTYRWTIANAPCVASQDNVIITFVAAPTTANAGPDQTICTTGGSATMAGNVAAVGTGTWTQISGPVTATITTPASATTTITGMTTAGTYVFQWSIANAPCAASTDQISVIVNAPPTASNAGPDANACGLTATLAGNVPANGTGTWTLVAGPGTASFVNANLATTNVTVSVVGVYTFRWTIANAPCLASQDNVIITFFTAPTTANAGPDQTICSTGGSATMAGNIPVVGTGTWTQISGPVTATITTPGSNATTITAMTTAGTYVFQWSIANAPCAASTDQISVIVNAPPTASNAGPDASVCGLVATLAGNTPATGTGTWTQVAGPGTTVFSNANSPTSTATASVIGVYTYRWTIANAPCAASQDNVVITFVQTPSTANAGVDQTICSSSGSATMAAVSPAFGTGLWTQVSGPLTATITIPTLNLTMITGMSTPGTYVFQWTVSNAPCTPSTDQVSVIVNAPPTASNAGPDASVCGLVATLAGNTPATGTGTWTQIAGPGTTVFSNANSPTSTATASVAGAYTYRWTIANAPCVASQDNVVITFVPAPSTANAGIDQTICSTSGSATMAAVSPGIGTGLWTQISGPLTATITIPALNLTTITGMSTPGTYVFQWTVSNAPCVASTDQVSVIVNAPPTASNAGPDQTICNNTATMAGNTPATGTGTWTQISGPVAATITTPGSPTTTITGITTAGAYVFQWTIANAPCAASSDQVTINRNATTPVSNAGPDQSLCNVTGTTLAGNVAAPGTGTWTQISGPNTATIATPNSPTSTLSGMITGTYVFQWTITNAPCAPTNDQVSITIAAPPTVASAGPDATVCGLVATLAGNTAAVGTGTWTQVAGPGTTVFSNANSPTSTATASVVGAYTYRWTIANSPCAASQDDVIITFVAAPTTANAGPDQTICTTGGSAAMAGNVAVIGSGTWTQISGPVTATIATPGSNVTTITGMTTAGTYVFQWSIANAPCASSTDQISVIVNAPPTASNAGPDQTVCATSATMAGNAPTTGSGTWTQISGPNTATITTPGSPSTTTTGLVAGVYVFQWTIANAPCLASSDQVTITVSTPPTTSNAGPDQTICTTTGSANMAGNTPVVGTGTWSQISGPVTATITAPASPSTTITGLTTPGAYIFQWTITNVCGSSFDQITVNVNAPPTTSAAGTDASICGLTATLAGNVPATGTGTWTQTAGPGTSTFTNANSATSDVTVSVAGTYSFTWTIANAPCAASLDVVVLTFVDAPSIAVAGSSQTICSTTGSVTMAGNVPAVGTGLWTQVSGPATATITTPSSATTTVTALTTSGTYVFQWTISNAPCADESDQMFVFVNDPPTPAAAGTDFSACGLTATLAGNTAATGTGAWTQNSGPGTSTFTNANSETSDVTVTVAGVYTFTWTTTNAPCASSQDDVTITFVDAPTAALAGADDTVCGLNGMLSANTPVIGTGTWTAIAGPGTVSFANANSETTSFSVSAGGTYTLVWSIANTPCPASTDTILFTLYEIPTTAAAGPDQNGVCPPAVTMAGNVALSGTGLWTQVSGPNTANILTPNSGSTVIGALVPGTYVFVWTISNGTCAPTTDTVAVTVIGCDNDGDGIPDLTDLDDDNDGIPDTFEASGDTDGDGIPDSLDLDSDNDGIPDVIEAGGIDVDGDGIIDGFTDVDGDGLSDNVDPDQGGTPLLNPDTDGDGINDVIDLDSDNDGIVDVVEAGGTDANGDGIIDGYVDTDGDGFTDTVDSTTGGTSLPTPDTDNDGLADYIDIDADDDGIVDNIEAQTTAGYVPPTGNDTDGDGIDDAYDTDNGGTPIVLANTDGTDAPDYLDLDSDNDGMGDLLEGWDTNNDGVADTTPSGNDSDGDGLDDAFDVDGTSTTNAGGSTNGGTVPTGFPDLDNAGGDRDWREPIDHDGDGIPDVNDLDDDNDGIPDTLGASGDTDGDGIPDSLDLDSDNDGIPDVTEAGGTDLDGDGIIDGFTDTDNDGLSDNVDPDNGGTPLPNPDTDGDGVNDVIDLDSDNDGIPDVTEAGGVDADGDGIIDGYTDTDGDGLSDNVDPNNGGTPLPTPDTDGDGINDMLDLDSDNDGITDVTEAGGVDANGDGIIDGYVDTDGDGLSDNVDTNNGGTMLPTPDTDGDGINDMLDLDSDNDGITDVVEAGGVDANGDGIIDGYVDTDNDGLSDNVDTNNGGIMLPIPDTDSDGNVDYLDIDADNDGIVDNIEAQTTAGYIPPTGNDTDSDGIDDAYDTDNGGTPIVLANTDGADNPDYLDLDSDNDGFVDLLEGWDTNNDGTPDTVPSGNDSDNDGLDDAFDVDGTSTTNNGGSANGGTVPTGFPDLDNVGGDRDWRDPIDHDGDGIPDITDLDDDNDGILDTVETTADTDGDGIPNSLDLDSDNDGIPDIIEVGGPDANGDGIVDNFIDLNNDGYDDNIAANPLPNLDTDGDGIPNALDLDSDNDGILDVIEGGGTDANGDGIIDNYSDSNGNGYSDNVDPNAGGTPLPVDDTDSDSHPNFLDIDADNDGIVDNTEGQSTGGYTPPTGTDSDGDGIDDAYDIDNGGTPINPVNTDGTDNPDYLDLDSDNDGDPDAVEAWDTNNDGDPEIIPSGNDSDGDGLDDAYDVDGTSTANNGGSTNGGTTPNSFPDLDTPGGDRDWREIQNPVVFVPTGFSPNNDNVNDYFEIVGIGAYPDNSVTIFNRWGNLVFEAAGYDNGAVRWDGENTGKLPFGSGPVPEGTYFYVIDLGDGSPVLSGYVFLNRQ